MLMLTCRLLHSLPVGRYDRTMSALSMYPIDLDHPPVIQELLDGHRRNAPVAGGDHHLLVIRLRMSPMAYMPSTFVFMLASTSLRWE